MDSNAARTEFVAIQHEVVALGTHLPRRGFEFFQVFVDDACEGMLRAHPGFVGFAPFEKWEAREPQEFPLRFVDHAERFAKVQPQLARDESGSFCTLDLFLSGNSNDEIARFRSTSISELLHVFSADQFLDRRGQTLRRHFCEIGAARVERLGLLSQLVELLARIACGARRRKGENVALDLQLFFCLGWKTMRHFA